MLIIAFFWGALQFDRRCIILFWPKYTLNFVSQPGRYVGCGISLSALGTQPAFDDDRGLLFREIVRVLKASKARSFLLENVPGLLECDDGTAIRAIKQDFKGERN